MWQACKSIIGILHFPGNLPFLWKVQSWVHPCGPRSTFLPSPAFGDITWVVSTPCPGEAMLLFGKLDVLSWNHLVSTTFSMVETKLPNPCLTIQTKTTRIDSAGWSVYACIYTCVYVTIINRTYGLTEEDGRGWRSAERGK